MNQDEENGREINDLVEEVQKNEEELEDRIHLALITRRLVKTQVTENDVDDQRDNLFHTRCFVKGTACGLVIDSGSWTNVVSTMLIKRLQIPTKDHPKPYKLQCLNDSGTMKVVSQALISFTLGKYKDEVLCDALPMQAGDILLGRPWQFDRRVMYNGYLNRYSFVKVGRKTTLVPLQAGDILLGRPWQFDGRIMYDGYLNRYSFVKDGRKTTLVPLSSANVFADQLKLEERKKEFEEKELKNKMSEKSKRKRENEKRDEIQEKRKRESYLAAVGEVRRFSQKSIFVLMYNGGFWSLTITTWLCLVFFNLFYWNLKTCFKIKKYLPLEVLNIK